MLNKKIKSLKDISLISTKLKKKKKKIVLCHGVFDLMHNGHINHFNEAKKHGDILIVSLTKDEFIKKGFNRPAPNFNGFSIQIISKNFDWFDRNSKSKISPFGY